MTDIAPHELHLGRPLHRLDPHGRDFAAEGHALQAIGGLVPVELPDRVPAWAITRRRVADQLLTHPDLRKNPKHWRAYQDGLIPETWPLLSIITSPTMLNMDGVDHVRLRKPTQAAFTPRRVQALRPRVEEVVHALLDDLAATEPGTVVDLRDTFAFQLPVTVICELYGLDDEQARKQLALDTQLLLKSSTPPAARLAAEAGIFGAMTQLVADKRKEPGADLTTALIAEFDAGQMSEQELAGTLFLMLFAGHETTQDWICNAVLRLAENPGQLARVLSGDAGADPWQGVLEETLRFDPPAPSVMFRYAERDVDFEGITIRAGEPVLYHVAAIGRDDEVFAAPDDFVPDRPNAHQHRAFGHGAHHCLGAALARLEAGIALPALYERFAITPAEPLESIERVGSLATNGPARLPVLLTPR
ncbi:cytochrome P450 family protein [Streptomyces sp. NPDC001927]